MFYSLSICCLWISLYLRDIIISVSAGFSYCVIWESWKDLWSVNYTLCVYATTFNLTQCGSNCLQVSERATLTFITLFYLFCCSFLFVSLYCLLLHFTSIVFDLRISFYSFTLLCLFIMSNVKLNKAPNYCLFVFETWLNKRYYCDFQFEQKLYLHKKNVYSAFILASILLCYLKHFQCLLKSYGKYDFCGFLTVCHSCMYFNTAKSS